MWPFRLSAFTHHTCSSMLRFIDLVTPIHSSHYPVDGIPISECTAWCICFITYLLTYYSFCCCDRTSQPKATRGGKCSSSLSCNTSSLRKNWRRNWSRGHGRALLTGLPLVACAATFLIVSRTMCPGWQHLQWAGPSHINWESLIQNSVSQTCPLASLMETVP